MNQMLAGVMLMLAVSSEPELVRAADPSAGQTPSVSRDPNDKSDAVRGAVSLTASIEVRMERQSIVRSGPHPFRSVAYEIVNRGPRAVYVMGKSWARGFQPAGDYLLAGERDVRKSEPTTRGPREWYRLEPGHTLAFNRDYSPSTAGKTIRADIYCSREKAGRLTMIATEAFALR